MGYSQQVGKTEKGTFVIDEEILSELDKGSTTLNILEIRLASSGVVHINRPEDISLNPTFCDVLAYVCRRAWEYDYSFKVNPESEWDDKKISAILGGRVEKNGAGYRVKR